MAFREHSLVRQQRSSVDGGRYACQAYGTDCEISSLIIVTLSVSSDPEGLRADDEVTANKPDRNEGDKKTILLAVTPALVSTYKLRQVWHMTGLDTLDFQLAGDLEV